MTAKLTTNPGDAVVTGTQVLCFLDATILGQTLLDKTPLVSPNLLTITPTINAETLDAPDGIIITLPETPLVSNKTLFNKTFGGSVPIKVPAPLPVGADVSLRGALQGIVRNLSVAAGLEINVDGNGPPQLVPDGTYVEVNASAGAAAALKLGASLGIAFVKQPLIAAEVGGVVTAIAQADVTVNFSGAVTGPITPTLDKDASQAGLILAYGLDWDYAINGGKTELHPDYHPFSIPLFGLAAPPVPDLSSLDNLLNGPGDVQTAALPGVPPSVGQVMSVLGSLISTSLSPTPSPDSVMSPQALRPDAVHALADTTTPTSTLTVATPVFAPISGVSLDLNTLASAATLAPGQHTLAVQLVGQDGSTVPLTTIDLAGSTLATNANPLGYASGWKTVNVPMPTAALTAGMAYQIEFLLTTSATSDGATVAVALDNLTTVNLQPKLTISTPTGSLTTGSGIETVSIANKGQVPLHVLAPTLSGTNVVLINPPAVGYVLLPGDSTDVQFKLVSKGQAASATLTLSSDDPAHSTYSLPIRATSTPTPTPTPTDTLVSGYGVGRDTFVTTLYSEDLGRSPGLSGLKYWSGVLAAGVKPKTVALAIYGSSEHRTLVNQHFVAPMTFQRSYANALLAGQRAARSGVRPAGPLGVSVSHHSS